MKRLFLFLAINALYISGFSQYLIEKVEIPQSGSFKDVCFTSPDTGFIAVSNYNDHGCILKTYNAGDSWKETVINASDVIYHVSNIQFTDDNTGYAFARSNSTRFILKTSDGGETWTAQAVALPQDIVDLHFVNSNLGYAAINEQDIYKLTAEGSQLSPLGIMYNGSSSKNLRRISISDINIAYLPSSEK